MRVDGRCLCGETTWEAEADPKRVFLCHCADCQIQSGGPSRTALLIDPANFRIRSGQLRTWAKTAESGAARVLAFCPTCGTSVYGGPPEGEAGFMSLRVGALAQRDALEPIAQLWSRSRQPWLLKLDAVHAFPTQPGAGDDKGE